MINQERLLTLFKKLVSLDSETYHEKAICCFLKTMLENMGLKVYEDNTGQIISPDNPAGNLYAVLQGTIDGDSILFSSHLDTVSPGNGKTAIIDSNGIIHSSGDTVLGADDLAGVSEIIELINVLIEDNIPHPTIEVLFSVAEEKYCIGSKYFDFSKIKSKKAYVLDMSGEIGCAAIAAPTIISFDAIVHGKSAHAGFNPQTGIHSIEIACRALSKIKNGFVEPDTTVNVGQISGGSGSNIVPETTTISGEIRSMEDEKAFYYLQNIKESLQNETSIAGGKLTFSFHQHFKAYHIDINEDVIKQYDFACKNCNITPTFKTTFGGSDNNRLVEHGICGIVISCGMNNVHTVNEYTTVADLLKATEILIELCTSR